MLNATMKTIGLAGRMLLRRKNTVQKGCKKSVGIEIVTSKVKH